MKLDNKTYIGLALIVASTVSLFFISQDQMRINKEEREKTKIEEQRQYEKQKEDQKEAKITLCTIQADIDYSNHWIKECEAKGLDADCSLPFKNIEIMQETRKQAKDYCFKLYK